MKLILIISGSLSVHCLVFANKIISYEYWFNLDYNNKIYTQLNEPKTSLDIELEIQIPPLNNIINNIYVRFLDSSGKWSPVSSWLFINTEQKIPTPIGINPAENKITKFEYWFNNDYAKRNTPHVDSAKSLEIDEEITVPKLPLGENNINIRFRDAAGLYTILQAEILIIEGDTLNILLLSGWNMISTYIEPENAALENIFSKIFENTVIVKNNLGQIYFPEFDINDIGNWDIMQGYQVYMSKAKTLTISGYKIIPEATQISLSAGWNIIAYLRDNPMDIETALAPLVDKEKLVIAKDNMGNVYYPAFEINMIGDMMPGQGYQIYLLSSTSLTYQEN